ncbi:MAG: type IX secretion system membrane protein PorP/SprF [Cyclobacteriaceae bacterium]
MKQSLLLLCLLRVVTLMAQDPEFSQYYAAPLYLNPAFAGSSDDHRFIANYRNQWPNVARGFVTYALSYDYDLQRYNSSLGVLAMVDKAGSAGMKSTQLNAIYAYRLTLGKKVIVSTGLNFGYGFRGIDFNRLLFGDQLQFDSDGLAPSDDPASYLQNNVGYFDFKAGMVAYSRKFWLGMAMSHINQPNRSLLDEQAHIPIKTTIHGGVRLPLYANSYRQTQEAIFSPSFVYKKQARFDQLDLGAYFIYSPVMLGLWYRGIPIQQNAADNISQDAAVIILGFQFDDLEIGYSYDFTVSELGPISGGTHEISLQYHFPVQISTHHKRKPKLIPCPTFNHKRK